MNSKNFDFSNNSAVCWEQNINNFACNYQKNFKILHLNINSIFCKSFFINQILNKQNFDILSIQETKLGNEIPDKFFPFYNIIRRDRCSGAGGLIVFVLKKYLINDLLLDACYETITFSLILGNKKHYFITSYNPYFSLKSTHLLQSASTLIDVVFCNSNDLINATETFGCPFSDHNFVVLSLSSLRNSTGSVTFESRFLTPEKLELLDQEIKRLPLHMLT